MRQRGAQGGSAARQRGAHAGQHCEVESAHVRQYCEVEGCPEEGSAMRGGMPMQARGSIGAVLMRRVPMRGSGDDKGAHAGQW